MKNLKRIMAMVMAAALLLGAVPMISVYAEAADSDGVLIAEDPAAEETPGEASTDEAEEPAPTEQEEQPPIEEEPPAEDEPVIEEQPNEGTDDVLVENTSYILEHANRQYTGDGDALLPMDFIYIAYTLVDAADFDHLPTLDELWLTNDDGDHISDFWTSSLGQFESYALLYSLDMDAPYYVGYIPDGFSNARLADWLAGSSNAGLGTKFTDIVFDPSANLVYVPKTYTDFDAADFGDAVGKVRLQALYASNVADLGELKTPVTVNLNDISAYPDEETAAALRLSATSSADVLAMAGKTEIQLPDNLIVKSVAVSGIPAEESDYSYDKSSGILTVNMNPVMVGTVDVTIERNPIATAWLPSSDYPRTGPIDRGTMESQLSSLDSLGVWSFADQPQEGDAYIIKSGTVAGYYPTRGGGTDGYKKPSLNVYGPYKGQPEHIMHFLYYNCYMSEAGELLYVKWTGFSKTTSTGTTPIQRYVLFSAQSSGISQDSPSGREITSLPDVAVDLFCAHVGIPNTYDNIDFSTGDNWMNKNDTYIVDEPIMMRIAYVSEDGTKAVVIVCTATVQTQAGVGIFLIEIIPPTPPGTPVSIQKTSALPGITNGNGCYSLKGAVYGLYSDAACKKLLEKLTTDASGNATSANQYDPGTTLYLKEISPSPGYLLDPNIYTIQIDESGNVTKK